MPRPTTGRILQIQNNEIVRIWNSQSEIVRERGYKNPMISRAVNTGCRAYGSYWRKENPEFKGRIFPQVGDVWEHKKHNDLLHIIEVGTNFITFIGFEDEVYPNKTYRRYHTNTFSSFSDDPRYTNFTEIFEYLGKSKVKIEDLFKTENE